VWLRDINSFSHTNWQIQSVPDKKQNYPHQEKDDGVGYQQRYDGANANIFVVLMNPT
jgi:hypothetical protein